MSKKDLRLSPINIDKQNWYYEEPRGICVVHDGIAKNQDRYTALIYIPWGKLKGSIKRLEK